MRIFKFFDALVLKKDFNDIDKYSPVNQEEAIRKTIAELDLSRKSLREISTKTFESLKNLDAVEELDLSDNQINKIEPNAFEKLKNLKKLYLTQAGIVQIESKCFEHLSNLKELSLNKNKLEKITSDMFDGLFMLEKLDLSENQIAEIDEKAFKHLSSLRSLLLTSNRLKGITRATFKYYMPEIEVIDLRNNPIDDRIQYFNKSRYNNQDLNDYLNQFPGSSSEP